jgi:hypothetical protein
MLNSIQMLVEKQAMVRRRRRRQSVSSRPPHAEEAQPVRDL